MYYRDQRVLPEYDNLKEIKVAVTYNRWSHMGEIKGFHTKFMGKSLFKSVKQGCKLTYYVLETNNIMFTLKN